MPRPTERDMMVVQDKLAELYATLSPAQRDVLDTIMAAGLSLVDEDDTGGYVMLTGQLEMEQHVRDRMASLQEDFRRANATSDRQPAESQRLTWDLTPLLDWFYRPQPRTA